MRSLKPPTLPRFGADAPAPARRAPKAKARSATVLADVPIRLRVSPSVALLPAPVRSTSVPHQFTFASFANALRSASAADTTVEVEAFCAAPTTEEAADLATIRNQWGQTPLISPKSMESDPIASERPFPPPPPPAAPRPTVAQSARVDHPHDVFDGLTFATTFDAGTISVERRFRDLDAQLDRESRAPATRRSPETLPVVDDAVLGDDLSKLRTLATAAAVTTTPVADIPLAPSAGGQSIDVAALKPGDILVSTVTSSPISAAIRFATNSPVSHSIVYLGDGQVAEAIEKGVVVRPIDKAIDGSDLVVAFRLPGLTDEQAAKIISFARGEEGKGYDFIAVVRNAAFLLDDKIYCSGKTGADLEQCRRWLGKVLIGPGDSNSYICSELVLAAYHHAGVPLTNTPPVWTSPGDVAEIALSHPLAYVGHLKAPIPR